MNSEPVIERLPRKIPLLEDDPDDFVGYEVLIDLMKQRALHELEGDIIEIGVYMGRGTAKLAKFAQGYGKMVFAIDVFDASLDNTISKSGIKAADVYEAFLQGRSMLEAYRESIRGFNNIVTVREDSKNISFPEEQRFIFGFIDGCHQQSYVENDFYVIWPHLVSGGVLGFHDYKFDDWPEVTKAVDKLIPAHKGEISAAYEVEGK
ncbi:MAG: class I SAM-dependent methyltransferase, partial [Dehalococcoidia bacterium]